MARGSSRTADTRTIGITVGHEQGRLGEGEGVGHLKLRRLAAFLAMFNHREDAENRLRRQMTSGKHKEREREEGNQGIFQFGKQ